MLPVAGVLNTESESKHPSVLQVHQDCPRVTRGGGDRGDAEPPRGGGVGADEALADGQRGELRSAIHYGLHRTT